MKEVYIDSALKSLASNFGNESISKLQFKSACTQDTQTQRIQEMITRASNLRKANENAEYYELSPGDDMEPPLELDSASSSNSGHPAGQQVDLSNYIHVVDYMGLVRYLENERRLGVFEMERRMHEINGNTKTKAKQ